MAAGSVKWCRDARDKHRLASAAKFTVELVPPKDDSTVVRSGGTLGRRYRPGAESKQMHTRRQL